MCPHVSAGGMWGNVVPFNPLVGLWVWRRWTYAKKPCHDYRQMSEGGAVFSSQSACLDWLIPQRKEVFSLKGTREREQGSSGVLQCLSF